jgi:hypothetical protein
MLTLEFLQPTRPLSVNEANRLHWAARKRRLDDWGMAVLAEWCAIRPAPEVGRPVSIQVTLTFPRAGRRDPHNYTGTNVKRIVDTLVRSCHLIPDDTAEWCTVLDPIIRVAPDNLCRVAIIPKEATT